MITEEIKVCKAARAQIGTNHVGSTPITALAISRYSRRRRRVRRERRDGRLAPRWEDWLFKVTKSRVRRNLELQALAEPAVLRLVDGGRQF
jgi:hypothetical protein